MDSNILKVDLHRLLKRYPKSEYPCLDYCEYLMKKGEKPNTRLEVWNNRREIPEADWVVKNIGKYTKDAIPAKKRGVRHRPYDFGMPL